MKKLILIYSFTFLLFASVFSQIKDIGNLAYVKNYTIDDYKGSAQIWSAFQDNNGIMYFGSNVGILQFDGKNWQKISVPNEVVRCFATDNNGIIYVGGKSEFGYLFPNTSGTLEYNSLLEFLPDSLRNCGNVWDVFINQSNDVIFHTYDAFYIYKDSSLTTIPVEDNGLLVRSFFIDDKIYVQNKGKGIEILNSEELTLIPNSEIFADEMVKGIFKSDNKLIFISWSQGVFEYDGTTFNKIITPIDDFINSDIYKILPVKNDYIAFGMNQNLAKPH